MSASCASRSTTFLAHRPVFAPSTTVTRFPPGRALERPQSPLGKEDAAGLVSANAMAPETRGEPEGTREARSARTELPYGRQPHAEEEGARASPPRPACRVATLRQAPPRAPPPSQRGTRTSRAAGLGSTARGKATPLPRPGAPLSTNSEREGWGRGFERLRPQRPAHQPLSRAFQTGEAGRYVPVRQTTTPGSALVKAVYFR